MYMMYDAILMNEQQVLKEQLLVIHLFFNAVLYSTLQYKTSV